MHEFRAESWIKMDFERCLVPFRNNSVMTLATFVIITEAV